MPHTHRGKAMDQTMDLRSANSVKRCHTFHTLVEETVGHHSANVAGLLILVYRAEDQIPSSELLCAALFHDYAEQFTGDVPAPAKWASRDLKLSLQNLEDTLGTPSWDLTVQEELELKWADSFDFWCKCLEELALGNSLITERLENAKKSCEKTKPGFLRRSITNVMKASGFYE